MPSWIGPWEIVIIVVIVLLIFGPRKLPELGSSLGKSIRGFRKGMKEDQDEVQQTVAEVREATNVSETPAGKIAAVEPPTSAPLVSAPLAESVLVDSAASSAATANAAGTGEIPKCWGTYEDGNQSCLQCGIAEQCAAAGSETSAL
jgi:sec-independent protein translocase protein TatA